MAIQPVDDDALRGRQACMCRHWKNVRTQLVTNRAIGWHSVGAQAVVSAISVDDRVKALCLEGILKAERPIVNRSVKVIRLINHTKVSRNSLF